MDTPLPKTLSQTDAHTYTIDTYTQRDIQTYTHIQMYIHKHRCRHTVWAHHRHIGMHTWMHTHAHRKVGVVVHIAVSACRIAGMFSFMGPDPFPQAP